jgi:hypothetical protein
VKWHETKKRTQVLNAELHKMGKKLNRDLSKRRRYPNYQKHTKKGIQPTIFSKKV